MDYARVLRLPQYFRNLQRLGEIVTVLVKHGFGDLVTRLNLYSYLETGLRLIRPSLLIEKPSNVDFGTRLRLVCEELGPTFIKFAQLVATRPDIFPDSVTRELRKLQDKVPSFPPEQARQVIEQELKHPLSELFSRFEEQPLAAASIAQVHRACLKNNTEVVVKVQRPHLDRIIACDIDILRGIAALIEERIPESVVFSPAKLVEEFEHTITLECDFRREAKNIARFSENFREDFEVVIPRVYPELSSTKVITEEFIDGVKADDITTIRSWNIDGAKVALTLNRVVLKSIFEHRFFHADPHPGNVFVTRDGRIALIDFGAMGRLDRNRLHFILQFFTAVLTRDLERIMRIISDEQGAASFLEEVALKNQIAEVLDTYLGENLGSLDISCLLTDVFEIVRRYGIRPPPDLLLVGKSLTTLEYIGAALDPGFDPTEHIKPYLMKRYVALVSDPRLYASQAAELADSYAKLIRSLPDDLRSILRNFSRENLVLQVASKDFAAMKSHHQTLMNRAIMAAIGLTLVTLGVMLMAFQDSRADVGVSYLLISIGALVLLSVWFAIRKTGGTSE